MPANKTSFHVAIPPDLPGVLKEYTKAILRNQPEDVLGWSARYFGKLADPGTLNGRGDSAEERVEAQELSRPNTALMDEKGQTISLNGLKQINDEFKDMKVIPYGRLLECWTRKGFSKLQLTELITVGEFYSGEIPRLQFMAVACSSMASSISDAMVLTIEVVREGKEAKIPFSSFSEAYRFVGGLDEDIPPSTIEKALKHLEHISGEQDGFITSNDVSAGSATPSLS